MNIIISRDERTFGPYSREQAKQFLESGELLSSDLASWDGNEEWLPLESLLSSSNNSEQTDDFEEEDPLDDFDHEKMKQWEGVFVDDEDEEEEEVISVSNQFIDDGFPDDQTSVSKPEEPVASVPPPISEVSDIQRKQTVSEPLPAVTEASVPKVEQETSEDLVPPPPPPPPAPSSKSSKSKTSPPKEEPEPESASQQSLTPRSKKIKGLNSRQTVIVVKGESILSKIYTTSLIFLILLVITCLIAVGGLFFSYGSVAPVLEDMGVPSGIIEAFKSQDENSRMDRTQNECVLSSVSRLQSEKEIIDSRGG